MKLKRITGVLLSVVMVLSGVSILYADNNESDNQLTEDNAYSDTLTETDVDTVIEADEIIPETIPDTEAANEVNYPLPSGDIHFDTSTGTITGIDRTVTETNIVIPDTILSTKVKAIGASAFSG